MASHCFICAKEFGFLKKEYGCANCGHSVCKKCRSKQAVVPKLGKALQNVCTKCFDQLMNPDCPKQNVENLAKYSPPANFKKRLEKQAEVETAGVAAQPAYHVTSKGQKKYKGLSPKDKEIAQRLEKLKEERIKARGPIPSTEEMEERLARLKGLDPEVVKQPTQSVLQPPVQKSFADQYDELFTEIADEVALDAKILGNQSQDAEDSLQKDSLHNTVMSSDTASSGQEKIISQATQDSDNAKNVSDHDIQQLIEQAEQEIKLEESQKAIEKEVEERLARLRRNSEGDTNEDTDTKSGQSIGTSAISDVKSDQVSEQENENRRTTKSHVPVDPDELPWCCICNEDAVLRCHGCEGDLFCKRCFQFGHDKYDQHEHKTTPYPVVETTSHQY